MQLGVGLPAFASDSHTIPPDRFRRYARHAEEYGFAGGWCIEHLVKPTTYDTSIFDPLTTLSLVAGETETLPVGTSVLLLPLRDPVMTAKRAVSLQHLSSRRVTLGLGTGYVPEEFDAVGVPREERSPRYLEGIELVYRLLHEDEVTFDGEFYSVEDFRLEPQLGQAPRVLAGGSGVETDDGQRVHEGVKARLAHADGWIAPPLPPSTVERDWRELEAHLEGEGRDPDATDRVALQYLHLVTDGDTDRARRAQRKVYSGMVGAERPVSYGMENWLTGTVDEVLADLADYERQGFDEVVLHPAAHTPDALDHQLDLWRRFLLPEYP